MSTQEHVSETLRRAVAGDRVGHAYLFSGPRGVGKTTLARVLAMALNCPNRGDDGEPCGTCESCEKIWGGHTSLDVVEIDAASNRGVDDARDLRERAQYAPTGADRFKVYIVDEAHMLTREAWNALLKVLEEPPPRVIFVFATTEPQKIQQMAAPILSRCQRFDLRRIGRVDITNRLRSVLAGEGIEAPEEALRVIARRADGGMRDALSLLDQVLSLTGDTVTVETVRQVLGLVEEERYLDLFDLLRERRHGDVFPFVARLVDEGYDLAEFYLGLNEALRTLLRVRLEGAGEGELSGDQEEEYRQRALGFEPGDLLRMLALASDLEATGSMRRAAQPRILLELLLLRLSHLDRTLELEDLLRGLGGLPAGPAGPGDQGAVSRRSAAPAASPAPAVETRTSDPVSHVDGPGAPASEPVDRAAAAPKGAEPGSTERSLEEVWQGVLKSDSGLPPGLGVLLRAAMLQEATPGQVTLEVHSGMPAERLQDPSVHDQVRRALSAALGREISLQIQAIGHEGKKSGRISQNAVREGRIRELMEQEPRLGPAVEALDLELME